MRKIFTVFFLCIQCSFLSAQITSIDSVEICAGQEVLVPVKGKLLYNLGALTLYIGFDTTNLTFVSVENIDAQLAGMSTNLMTMPTQLAFAWSSTIPVNFIDNKLFDLKFVSNGQSSDIHFNNGCELSDSGGIVINTAYLDGSILNGNPVILENPSDTIVLEGGTAGFHVVAPAAMSFLWRESSDNGVSWIALDDNEVFSGTATPDLTINQVPLAFNGYLYQCVTIRGNCTNYSDPATLHVDELSGSIQLSGNNRNWIKLVSVPFDQHLKASFFLAENGNFALKIFDPMGKLVVDLLWPGLARGLHHISFDSSDWPYGLYLLSCNLASKHGGKNGVIKVLKQKNVIY